MKTENNKQRREARGTSRSSSERVKRPAGRHVNASHYAARAECNTQTNSVEAEVQFRQRIGETIRARGQVLQKILAQHKACDACCQYRAGPHNIRTSAKERAVSQPIKPMSDTVIAFVVTRLFFRACSCCSCCSCLLRPSRGQQHQRCATPASNCRPHLHRLPPPAVDWE